MKFFTAIMACFIVMSAGRSIFAQVPTDWSATGTCGSIRNRATTTAHDKEYYGRAKTQCQGKADTDSYILNADDKNAAMCAGHYGYAGNYNSSYCGEQSVIEDPLITTTTTNPAGSGNAFEDAADKLYELFEGLRGVVYALALIAFIGFAIASMLGKLDWKKVAMLGAGLFLLSIADAVVQYSMT